MNTAFFNDYKVGDEVECIIAEDRVTVGSRGIIVDIEADRYGISWKNIHPSGHNCRNTCNDGTGWYVHKSSVKLVTKKELNYEYSIF